MNCDVGDGVRNLALSPGADYFGIADLLPARDVIAAQGGKPAARYPRAVVMGIRLPDSLVDRLPGGKQGGTHRFPAQL